MYGTIKSVEEDERDGRTPVREISITSLLTQILEKLHTH